MARLHIDTYLWHHATNQSQEPMLIFFELDSAQILLSLLHRSDQLQLHAELTHPPNKEGYSTT